jgi:hypothetical protein
MVFGNRRIIDDLFLVETNAPRQGFLAAINTDQNTSNRK